MALVPAIIDDISKLSLKDLGNVSGNSTKSYTIESGTRALLFTFHASSASLMSAWLISSGQAYKFAFTDNTAGTNINVTITTKLNIINSGSGSARAYAAFFVGDIS